MKKDTVFFPVQGLLIFILLAYIDDNLALDVSVVIPTAARVRDTVSLQCKYDLEGEPLYTLKWYKGTKEFYRYIPKELPNTQTFSLPGINIDKDKSNPNNLVLTNIQPEVTGRYKCEVSSDAPNFYTLFQSGYMYVIDVPDDDPVLALEKDVLEVGHILKGNCTSPPSYPSANITWLLNGKKINDTQRRTFPVSTSTSTKKAPLVTYSELEVELEDRHFYSGKATIACYVNIFDLYKKRKELVVEEDRPRPRPSSVLGNRDSSNSFAVAPSDFVLSLSLINGLIACLR
ncbi:uncharacterized protein LOC130892870 [Diorhabda carinulata]|uniref:uncharacterized protein LOC130892870 n=1 Tax=Diorhabda carinulata TaxID=1163345 RepID=UPI0025A1B8D5|nr:uncharacterized protein LOC130892870 [Diorhabda carinulata]